MTTKVDWLVIGAGYTGSVLAERIAAQLDQRVLVIDRRDHIAGNAYDYVDENGVLVHKYGPHIFHTNSDRVWQYLSMFTEWRPYSHHVLGVVDGQRVPVPFNLNSLHELLPADRAAKLEDRLIKRFGPGGKVPILKLREGSDPDLRALGEYVYEKIFYGYTVKQWGLTPEELSPTVTGRVPIVVSRDDRYFHDKYQAMPKLGYTAMFRRILDHPNIQVVLGVEHRDIVDEVAFDRMIYTGAVDTFFENLHGELPYRSLRFELSHEPVERFQPVAQVNYPNDFDFTRITEFKHLTGQRTPGTTIAYEFPQAFEPGVNEPYYPIPRDENKLLFARYQREMESLGRSAIFAGRLADYRYYNMDQATARALTVFEQIKSVGWAAAL